MKKIILGFFFLGLIACEKTKCTENSTGKVLFYSDAFVAANCILDSITIYIDDIYIGKLTNSYFPLNQIPSENDSNTLTKELDVKEHTYTAKLSGCSSNIWKGTLNIKSSELQKINLTYLTSKP